MVCNLGHYHLPYSGLTSRGENFEVFADFALSSEILITKIFLKELAIMDLNW